MKSINNKAKILSRMSKVGINCVSMDVLSPAKETSGIFIFIVDIYQVSD